MVAENEQGGRITLRQVTKHAPPERFREACEELAVALAASDVRGNQVHLAKKAGEPDRRIRRWIKCARDQGIDVVARAKAIMKARGIEPWTLGDPAVVAPPAPAKKSAAKAPAKRAKRAA